MAHSEHIGRYFLAGSLPLILVLNRVTQESVPRYPKIIDVVFGFIFGFIAATILVCCVMTSLSVIAPKIWEPYNRDALTVRLDRFPIAVYQDIEDAVGVKTSDPGRTRFPSLTRTTRTIFRSTGSEGRSWFPAGLISNKEVVDKEKNHGSDDRHHDPVVS